MQRVRRHSTVCLYVEPQRRGHRDGSDGHPLVRVAGNLRRDVHRHRPPPGNRDGVEERRHQLPSFRGRVGGSRSCGSGHGAHVPRISFGRRRLVLVCMDVRRRLVGFRCAGHVRVCGSRGVSGDGRLDGWKRGDGLLVHIGDDLRHRHHRERVPDERRRDHGLHGHGIGEPGAAPYSYGWTFGDGSTGSGSAVNHVYPSAGAMTVTCTATDSASASAAAPTSVDVSPSPSVGAYANPSAAAPGTSLTFSAQATGGPGGFTDYAWSLGDGATGSGVQVAHAFAQPGTYQASVVVTDANGGTASGSVSVTISNIQVTASGTPASGNTDTTFEFSATATGGGGDPFSYSWDFGDGQSGVVGPAVSHRYPNPGDYAPFVRATDSLGAGRTVALSPIAVSSVSGPPPQPLSVTMSLSTSLPRVNEAVSLSGTGRGGAGGYTCAWNFGDGVNSTACSTSHAWAAVGHYAVIVVLSDSGGNRTSDSRTVDVQPNLGPPGGPLNVAFRMTTSLAPAKATAALTP